MLVWGNYSPLPTLIVFIPSWILTILLAIFANVGTFNSFNSKVMFLMIFPKNPIKFLFNSFLNYRKTYFTCLLAFVIFWKLHKNCC